MLLTSPIALVLLLLGFGQAPASYAPADSSALRAAPIRVLSFNIRYNNPDDGIHAWPNRKDHVAGLIRFHGADLVGVQEALKGQVDTLAARLPGYGWFGVGRADGASEGEFSAIFYREDRFEVLDEGTFWLSETPDSAGSRGWDAALPRIVTWGHLRDRTSGEAFYYFNTHFDHRGERARLESARLLRTRIGEIAGSEPFIVTGDFNATPGSPPYEALTDVGDTDGGDTDVGDQAAAPIALRDAYHATADAPYGPTETFHGFEVGGATGGRIDYVFVSEDVRVLRYGVLTDHEAGRYPSDHLPVLADVVIESD